MYRNLQINFQNRNKIKSKTCTDFKVNKHVWEETKTKCQDVKITFPLQTSDNTFELINLSQIFVSQTSDTALLLMYKTHVLEALCFICSICRLVVLILKALHFLFYLIRKNFIFPVRKEYSLANTNLFFMLKKIISWIIVKMRDWNAQSK